MVTAMRLCKICGTSKPPSGFYNSIVECKDCWRARVKLRRLTDPSVRAYDRARAKTPARAKKATAVTKSWRQRNPDAYRAHSAVNYAIRIGKLERGPCAICAETKHVHAHHRDYSKPLEVIWLCARCHHRLHALFPEFEGANKRQAGA